MVFFSQKIHRKVPGNWTFLVVTDREELDRQIYQNFAGAGVVTEPEEAVRAASGEHLKQLLRDDHRYLFTLVQKFHTGTKKRKKTADAQPPQPYPKLSDRDDIIVMADEAHRTQYDTLALNMRTGLPRAAYGRTGSLFEERFGRTEVLDWFGGKMQFEDFQNYYTSAYPITASYGKASCAHTSASTNGRKNDLSRSHGG